MPMRGRLQRYFDRHPTIVVAVGSLLLAGVGVMDVGRVLHAHEALGSAMLRPALAGFALLVVTAGGIAWLVRRWHDFPARHRSWWSRALVTWGIVVAVSFISVHPRGSHVDSTPTTAWAISTVAYSAGFMLLLAVLLPIMAFRVRRRDAGPREHQPSDPVEVWHMRDGSRRPAFAPYFIARCECGWVGDAHDESDDGAESRAFADARSHGSNVKPDVAYPMD